MAYRQLFQLIKQQNLYSLVSFLSFILSKLALGSEGECMKNEKQVAPQNEESKYYNEVPPEILENMTPEIRQQYFLWDEMLKKTDPVVS